MSEISDQICGSLGELVDSEGLHVESKTSCIDREGRIIQMIPALAGWRARGAENGVAWEEPIIAWALVEVCDGHRDIRPVYRHEPDHVAPEIDSEVHRLLAPDEG